MSRNMTYEDAIKKINLLKMVAVKKGTDTEKAVDMAIEALKEKQAEIDMLKAEKDEIIRKIGHARIDNIAPTDAKSTEVIYKHGVVDGLAYAQDIVDGKDGEQE